MAVRPDAEAMGAELGRRGVAEVAARIEKAITTASVWGAGPRRRRTTF